MAEKSALYPKVPWEECLDFVRTVSSFNLKSVSYNEVAKKYGLSNPTAKSFTSKLSSSKQFGLITTSGGNTIQITDTCRRILFPTGEDTTNIVRACFGMPPLYNKLIARFDGKAIPNKDLLANILMNDYQIQKPVKDIAAKSFIQSAEQLGLIKGGILCYAESENALNLSAVSTDSSVVQNVEPSNETDLINESSKLFSVNSKVSSEADYITQAIPFESGKIARFIIPIDATEDDLLLLRDMFDVILKRKFKLKT